MTTTLIVGAGRLGALVAARRQAAGDRVLCVNRTTRDLPKGVVPLLLDVTQPNAFSVITESLQRIVYCVGPDSRAEEAYRRCFVLGLNHLLSWLEAAQGNPRLVFVSSTAVYAQSEGEWVNEQSVTAPTALGPQILLEAEALVRSYGVEGIVLRLAGLYQSFTPRLLDPRRADSRYVNRIHVIDAAAAVEHLLLLKAPAPLYIGADDEPSSRKAVLDWLSEQYPSVTPVFDPHPNDSRRSSKRCSNAQLRQSGFSLQYPTFRDGYRETLSSFDWCSEDGEGLTPNRR